MRVLHVIPSLLPKSGGPARIVPEICRALAATSTEVTLFSTHLAGADITIDAPREPYEVVLFHGADGSLGGARRIENAIRDRKSDFDLVHIHSFWNFVVTFAACAARQVGLPYVITPMGMLSEACMRQRHYILKRAYALAIDRRTVQGAARLHLANVDELKSLHKGWFTYPEHFFARNAVEIARDITPGSFRARFPELVGRRIMLFLGRLHPIKGLELQFRALELLVPKYPDLVWLLIGPDDGEWKRLDPLIKKSGLEAHVKWIGPIMGEERFSALADADVLVQTSSYECQSMTVNEALAIGVPLVVTDSVNYSELQAHGAGFVVRRDPAALADAIDSVLRAPRSIEQMRNAGRRFATEELSRSKIARAINGVYAEVAGAAEQRVSGDRRREAQIKHA
jgi:glycosyltransferase involved in cell wall biosynthesis